MTMKTCVVLDEKIINVGEWDYQYIVDENEEQIAGNPLPEGSTIEEREFEYSDEYGWREVGAVVPLTDAERIEMLENTILFLLTGGM